ncbi:Ferredoxin reductase [[Actinomadura] parvosata subsp. kistnae]|uniref:FAD-dependent oxidoreductase n=1 Tax=[Actinomadura] parvosata subsp. kistnae TaxID=1909395 RepID=A0A1V0AHC6_9ACTN|nr:FAD-dependent oxidoreductase [Nonomuraea sp. ATCC 55076]AQZ69617.1 FAD-dependent oxidoreductase [Nonomuraea sp. ATCC 55076]SPL91687.1 Ferredoxin reductase [Actinomadura parvosata subsp. kistnae]
MTPPRSVLIVGASAAGLSTAEALRRQGHQGRLTLLDAEPHLPYDRPPLSKQVLAGDWEPGRAQLRSQAQLDALDAEFVRGEAAVAFDAGAREVRTATGRVLRADAVVIATGLTPHRLPGQQGQAGMREPAGMQGPAGMREPAGMQGPAGMRGPGQQGLAGVHELRGLDDALTLRAHLTAARRLVVVGEGVLGGELAATARKLGLDVTLVGLGQAILADQLGGRVSGLLTRAHAERGVELRLGVAVEELTSAGGRVTGVRLATGEVLPADAVVVAIGSRPATGWLAGSGLSLGDGVECDARCRAAEGVYAVGDVASWQHEGLGRRLRLENRTNATEQAQVVAANILGADRPYTPIPYFWTDQYDIKIQAHGLPSATAEVSIVEGDPEQGRFAAVYREDGRVTGVLGWNMPKQARVLRQQHLATQPVATA